MRPLFIFAVGLVFLTAGLLLLNTVYNELKTRPPSVVKFEHYDKTFSKTYAEVPAVSVNVDGTNFNIKAYGLNSALAISQNANWDGVIHIKIKGIRARTFRLRYRPWVELIEVYYGEDDLKNVPWASKETLVDAAYVNSVTDTLADRYQTPIVELATPGAWGSSGSLELQYSHASYEIINKVIDVIVEQTGAERIVLSGVSSSANVASGVMLLRNDISCVVLASAPLNLEIAVQNNRSLNDYMGAQNIYDPYNKAESLPIDEERTIYIGYSKTDEVVSPSSPTTYAEQLRNLGHNVVLESAPPITANGHNIGLWVRSRENRCLGIE